MLAALIIGGIVFAVFLLPRIFAKGAGAVLGAGQKTIFKKQIAESDDLIDVPLVLTSSATPKTILDALEAIIHPSKEPPGYAAVLYQVSREPMRAVYAIGSKLQPQQLVTELRLSEHDGKTEMVFRVLTAMRTENIFICKEALLRLREQVKYVAECGADETKLAEGARIYRAAEPELAKRQTAMVRAGSIMSIVAVLWLGGGVQIRLLPIWLMLVAASGALIYIGRKPIAKAERESSAAAEQVLHPDPAQVPPHQPAAAASVVAEPAAAAIGEPSVAPTAPDSPTTTPGSGLLKRFSALPQQAKLVVVLATVVTVLIFAVVLVGSGNSKHSYANQGDAYSDDAGIEVDPDALSPDTHARMESDLYYSAPTDGSIEFSDVVYASGEDQGDGTIYLEFTLVSRNPAEWYITVLPTDVGYYIDYEEVSMSEYLGAINGTGDAKGMVVFDDKEVYELHVFTRGQKASASTPEKDQVTIVPDFRDFGSEIDETNMEWSDVLDAYIASIEQGFEEAGLVGVVELEQYTGTEKERQEPAAGSAVPVGTKVYITIPVAD